MRKPNIDENRCQFGMLSDGGDFLWYFCGGKTHPYGANRAVLKQLSHPPCWPHLPCVVPSRGPGCHRDPLSRVFSIGLSAGAGANTDA